MMSLMNQATTPFTVLVSMLLLGTRYSWIEMLCVAGVLGAAVLSVFVEHSGGEDNDFFWAVFAAATTSFAALSFVLKEKTFNAYNTHLASVVTAADAGSMLGPDADATIQEWVGDAVAADVKYGHMTLASNPEDDVVAKSIELPPQLSVFLVGFIVATVGLLTCVPIALLNQAILEPSDPVMPTFRKGMRCLTECDHALPSYFVYAACNVTFNIALLTLTAYSSALLTFLSLKMMVPLVALFSPVDWPLIGSHSVSAAQWGVLAAMILAVVLFRWGNVKRVNAQEVAAAATSAGGLTESLK